MQGLLPSGALAALAPRGGAARGRSPGPAPWRPTIRVGDGRGGVAQAQDRQLRLADLRHPRPRRAPLPLRGRAGGTVRVLENGNPQGQPFLDISRPVSTGGERGLLSIAFDPDYERNHLFYAYYTNARATSRSTSSALVQQQRAGELAPPGDRDPAPGRRTTTAASSSSARTETSTPATGDGGGAGDPQRTPRTSTSLLGKLLRIDPRSTAQALPSPRGNPFVGKRRPERDLRARPAQPVPLLVQRRPDPDRRRRPGHAGRRSTIEAAARLRGANFGWDHFEGDHRFNYPGDNEAPRPKHRYQPPIFEYSTRHRTGRGRLRDHRRLRRPQRRAPQPPWPLPVRRLRTRVSCGASSPAATTASATGRWASTSTTRAPSARERTGESTWPPWMARSTGSCTNSRRRSPGDSPPARRPVPAVESACDGERHGERGRSPARIARWSLGPPTSFEVRSPADGSLIRASRSTRRSASPRSSPGPAPRSRSGRRSASPAAAAGSTACATG